MGVCVRIRLIVCVLFARTVPNLLRTEVPIYFLILVDSKNALWDSLPVEKAHKREQVRCRRLYPSNIVKGYLPCEENRVLGLPVSVKKTGLMIEQPYCFPVTFLNFLEVL